MITFFSISFHFILAFTNQYNNPHGEQVAGYLRRSSLLCDLHANVTYPPYEMLFLVIHWEIVSFFVLIFLIN